nr:cation-translocating P-type ATPase C-terminal domain-containing protein [Synechococcus sp. CS-1328]
MPTTCLLDELAPSTGASMTLGLMQRPPSEPGESILSAGIGSYILRNGVVFALITICLMLLAVHRCAPWTRMVFTTLCLAQMGHALSARSNLPCYSSTPSPIQRCWRLWPSPQVCS